jgi:hypothetical protein
MECILCVDDPIGVMKVLLLTTVGKVFTEPDFFVYLVYWLLGYLISYINGDNFEINHPNAMRYYNRERIVNIG